jgi:hypothetical protein
MKHEIIDPRLDHLYNRNVRCPYCHAKILKYTTTCPRCGVHKKQIFDASNARAKQMQKEKTGGKIFLTRRRPDDVSFTKMAFLILPLGLFGAHWFYIGRRYRAWFMLVATIIGLSGIFIPESVRDIFMGFYLPFPTDAFLLASILMWAYDTFAVVFGFFKYPIRLGEQNEKTTPAP